jgi:hypothetical protein
VAHGGVGSGGEGGADGAFEAAVEGFAGPASAVAGPGLLHEQTFGAADELLTFACAGRGVAFESDGVARLRHHDELLDDAAVRALGVRAQDEQREQWKLREDLGRNRIGAMRGAA